MSPNHLAQSSYNKSNSERKAEINGRVKLKDFPFCKFIITNGSGGSRIAGSKLKETKAVFG